MPKPQPKIAEIRSEACKRVNKCTTNDLELLNRLLDCLEYRRRKCRTGADAECDPVRLEHWILLRTVLTAHDEAIPRMLNWCNAVEHNVMEQIANAKKAEKSA